MMLQEGSKAAGRCRGMVRMAKYSMLRPLFCPENNHHYNLSFWPFYGGYKLECRDEYHGLALNRTVWKLFN
uniref:Uncharacterized protein n=1 Tax=Cannabis sativa TaxID=3483 RepID=A0A803QF30_CANSA